MLAANNSVLLCKYIFTLGNPYEAELKANVNSWVNFCTFSSTLQQGRVKLVIMSPQ